MELEVLLVGLKGMGCFPNISLRGQVWRAHVNGAGNYWAEAETPYKALDEAIKLWKEAGKPMDGYAASK